MELEVWFLYRCMRPVVGMWSLRSVPTKHPGCPTTASVAGFDCHIVALDAVSMGLMTATNVAIILSDATSFW